MPTKLVFGFADGKSVQKEIDDEQSKFFHGAKIGDAVKGDDIGFSGGEFKITGGSDDAGFPMRWDVPGIMRKRIFAVEGVGLKKQSKGGKQRKTVAGNTVHAKTHQINLKVLKDSSPSLVPKPEEPAKEEAAGAKPSE